MVWVWVLSRVSVYRNISQDRRGRVVGVFGGYKTALATFHRFVELATPSTVEIVLEGWDEAEAEVMARGRLTALCHPARYRSWSRTRNTTQTIQVGEMAAFLQGLSHRTFPRLDLCAIFGGAAYWEEI